VCCEPTPQAKVACVEALPSTVSFNPCGLEITSTGRPGTNVAVSVRAPPPAATV